MRMTSALVLLLLTACPSSDDSDKSTDTTDDTSETAETGDTGDGCETGPGVVDGVLLGSDGVPLTSGKVRLYDETGSEELVADDVNSDGAFHLVYGKGDYVVRGEYSTCVGEDIPVSICGNVTKIQSITLSCAP